MNQAPDLTLQEAEPLHYDKRTVLFSWLSLAVGYLYCRTFFITNRPFYGFLFTLLLFAFGALAIRSPKPIKKDTLRALFYPASALLLNCSLFISGAPVVQFFVFTYSLLAFLLFCHFKSNNRMESLAGSLYFFDLAKAVLFAPFTACHRGILAIFSDKRGKKLAKGLLFTLCGLLLAFLPTLLVLGLLSFDQNFKDALDGILDFSGEQLLSRLAALIFGVPAGMYFFGAAYASSAGTASGFTASSCRRTRSAMAFSPAIVGVVALLPLLFLYVVFIFAQKDYYAAVLSGTLPASHTFSSFARDGFFRLIAVAVINLICLVSLRLFTKKNAKGHPSFAVTLSTVILSLVTVVLCATAISQMAMYVSAYGLTRLRLYALWFMALLAVFFLLIALCRVIPKIPFAPVAIPLFLLCFALLALPDSDAVIARHNYNCYLKDNSTELDLHYMEELGPSAIPTLCKIAQNDNDPALQKNALFLLAEYESNKEFSIKKLSLPLILADLALDGLDKQTKEQIDHYLEVYFTDAPVEPAQRLYTRYYIGEQNGTIMANEVKDYLSQEAEQQYFKPYNKGEVSDYFNCFYDLSGEKWRIDGIQTDVNASQRAFYFVKEVTPGTPKDGFVLYVYLELPRTVYTEAPENATLYTLIYYPV